MIVGSVRPTSKEIYDKINENIEKWSELIDYVNTKLITTVAMSLTAIILIYTCFTRELEDFRFAIPFW